MKQSLSISPAIESHQVQGLQSMENEVDKLQADLTGLTSTGKVQGAAFKAILDEASTIVSNVNDATRQKLAAICPSTSTVACQTSKNNGDQIDSADVQRILQERNGALALAKERKEAIQILQRTLIHDMRSLNSRYEEMKTQNTKQLAALHAAEASRDAAWSVARAAEEKTKLLQVHRGAV